MTNNIDSTQNEDNTTIETVTTHEEMPVRKDLGLTYISINFLKEVAKWAKFISIVGFVFVGFMVIVGISMGSFMNSFNNMMPEDSPAIMAYGGGLFGAVYIIMAAIYAIPVYYLYKFSSKLKTAIQQHNETILEESLKNLKSHYKFLGIMLILFLVLYGGIFTIFGLSTLFL
jgi:hypothetical protein